MVPSNSSEPPRSEVSKVKWFTEGEFWWRTFAAVTWVMIILPHALLLSSLAASVDLFHPFNWISGGLSLVLSFPFWISTCFYGAISIVVTLSNSKFNTVKNVTHQNQMSALLFPLHPARMFHIFLFTLCGSLSAWCFQGIIGDEEDVLTILCETSEEYCLNERLVFGILFGAWLGFYTSLNYFLRKKFHFVFPRVQQKVLFQIKLSVGPCVKESIIVCLKACGWYYLLYYFLGNIPRDATANILDISLDRNVTPLNSIAGLLNLSQFWHLVTTGSFILFVWTFGNKLLIIFHTQIYRFPVEYSLSHQQDQSLCVVIKNKTIPLLKYLALFDLVHLSQFSLTRRKQIFSLSQPSGRPDNWTNISTECLSLIESLTHKLSAEVSLQTHRQQPVLDPKVLGPALVNGHANGHTGQSSPLLSSPYQSPLSVTRRHQSLSSPGTVYLWSDKTENSQKIPSPKTKKDFGVINHFKGRVNEMVDSSVSKINQIPHRIACRLKEIPVIGFLFDKIPETQTQALFADCQLQIWAVEALSRLVASSYTEDTYGVVQKSLPKIFVSLLNLLQALDQHSKLSLVLISRPEIQPRPPQPQGYQLRATLVSSIYRITKIFHEHLRNLPMAVEHEKKLESFLMFRE